MLLSRAGASPALCNRRCPTARRSPAAAAVPAPATTTKMSGAVSRPLVRQRGTVAANASAAENFSGDMLEPSTANKLPVRAAALAASVTAAAYFGAPALSQSSGAFVHLLSVGAFLGTSFYTTFIAGIVMFKNLPRQTFGKLQSKLFPIYFWGLATSALVAFGTLAAATPGGAAATAATFGGKALLIAAGGSLANALVLEPRATSVMFERYALENKYAGGGGSKSAEDEAKTKALGKRFGALHGGSSLANLVALCGMVAYSWQLAGRVVLAA